MRMGPTINLKIEKPKTATMGIENFFREFSPWPGVDLSNARMN